MERRSESTADLVAESLRELIASGEAMDGTRLVERDLAEKFGVSRIPLREALQRLESRDSSRSTETAVR
jgi:DNA-binding GntR family transcriptional regulator